MRKEKRLYAHAAILEKKAAKEIGAVLVDKLGVGKAVLLSPPTAASDVSVSAAYETQFRASANGHWTNQPASYAVSEAKLVFEGCEMVVGFRIADVVGADLAAKCANLANGHPLTSSPLRGSQASPTCSSLCPPAPL